MLQKLKADHGEEIYGLVIKAMCEIIKYNASGRYPVNRLWNYKEDRNVSPDEVVQYLMKKCITKKKSVDLSCIVALPSFIHLFNWVDYFLYLSCVLGWL